MRIIRPDRKYKFSYQLKDGTIIQYDTAGEFGEAAAELGFDNPYYPDCKDFDYFENGKYRALERIRQGGAE